MYTCQMGGPEEAESGAVAVSENVLPADERTVYCVSTSRRECRYLIRTPYDVIDVLLILPVEIKLTGHVMGRERARVDSGFTSAIPRDPVKLRRVFGCAYRNHECQG